MKIFLAWAAAVSFCACLAMGSSPAFAALVTNDVIFGSGNINGDFTVDQSNGVEIGLRGKLRYNTSMAPENTFNYDGGNTYTFNTTDGNAPANRSIWNFEWSVNTDYLGTSGLKIGDLAYSLTIDFNPGAGVTGLIFDPINVLSVDHSFGDNSTGQGAGVEAADATEYATFLSTFNLVQQSWNLGFFAGGNVQLPGVYTISLAAFDGNAQLAATSIDIVVTAVPLPASLLLFAGALGALALISRRRLRQAWI